MGTALVIVESPAKAKTINKFLGRGFLVKASMGHVRDLPKRTLGVDDEFTPTYTALAEKKKTIAELKKAAKGADAIYLASDPDREGEAICWHLKELLKDGTDATFHRVLFNEITKHAIREAFDDPREIDLNKVDAQQARRILDRLVGYKISPLLWDKVRRGLSAGRVQSVALRIICERERDIKAFTAREYWSVAARLAGDDPPPFMTKLHAMDGKKVELAAKDSVDAALRRIGWHIASTEPTAEATNDGAVTVSLGRTGDDATDFLVAKVQSKRKRKNPAPPFTTSKLQQDAARQLGFGVSRTMRLAQRLYEGVELSEGNTVGLITYMRTDSTRVSQEALDAVREFISKTYGGDSLPDKPRMFKAAARAQEAHEAVRPTSMELTPDRMKAHLGRDELRLYTLIWNRFLASQMEAAVFDTTSADIEAGPLTFRATGSILRSAGWLAVYHEARDEDRAEGDDADDDADRRLPALVEGQRLSLEELRSKQHFTQPPPRFSEATLVKELEENGIGRPSTYASILSTIQNRDYVQKEQKRFHPTELGLLVNDLMVDSFGDIVDVGYTARMEEELDQIEAGQLEWVEALREFNTKFEKDLELARTNMRDVKREAIPTDQVCDKCNKPMVLKWGRFGQFIACSGYPDCKNTREVNGDSIESSDLASMPAAAKTAKIKTEPNPIEAEADPCEKCGSSMVLRRGRYGPFLACSSYPDCKTTRKVMVGRDGKAEAKADVLLDEKCPKCDSQLACKQGRFGEFTACSDYPKCRFVKMKTTDVECPECGKGEIVERRSKRGKVFYGCANYPSCEFVLWRRPVGKSCPQCGRPYLVERITKRSGRQLICDNENCEHVESEEAASAVEA